MPPINQQMDLSSVSDSALSQMLKDYGVDVGPINALTRKTYERKLIKLKTGLESPSSLKYDPVDDDDEEEEEEEDYVPLVDISTSATEAEVQFKQPAGRRSPIPEPTHSRLRRETPQNFSSPRIESRPSLSVSRKTTTSYEPANYQSSKLHTDRKSETTTAGKVPSWVKILCLAVVVLLIFLIYTNMEPRAESTVPSISLKL